MCLKRALFIAPLLATAIVIVLNTLWSFEAVRDYNMMGRDDARIIPQAEANQVARRSVFRDADCMMWNLYATEIAEGGKFRIRHTDFDNYPFGREVHWSSGYAWLLALSGRLWKFAAGGGYPHRA